MEISPGVISDKFEQKIRWDYGECKTNTQLKPGN